MSNEPVDLEVEQTVLATLLARPFLFDDIDQILEPTDFSDPIHSKIFRAMREFGGPFTPLALKKSLMGVEIGGLGVVDYLDSLEKYSCEDHRDVALPRLAAQLIDYSRRRTLIDLCNDLSQQASSSNAPAYIDLLEQVEENLYRIPATGETFAVKTVADGGDESLAAARKIMDEGGDFGLRPALRAWNRLVGPMLPGDLIVVGGTTSAGKTALAQQVAYECAKWNPVLVFSLEMTLTQWTNRYLAQETGVATEKIETGKLTEDEYTRLFATNAENFRPLKMVVSDRPCLAPAQIRSYAKRVRRKLGGLSLIVIDHLQFITPPARTEGPAATAAITRDLKAMAKDLEVPVILVSHLNRDVSHRDNKRPVLSDLFGSSAIEKDADCVLFVHREHYWLARKGPAEPENPEDMEAREKKREQWQNTLDRIKDDAELILAKRRRGRGDGAVTLDFNLETTKFADRIRAF